MTVFDDRDDDKPSTRVKNFKRVFSAKYAHKKWGGSYKMGNRNRKSSRLEALYNEFKTIAEAEVKEKNRANLYANIDFESTTGGVEIKVDEKDFRKFNISLVFSEDAGNGYYNLLDDQADKEKSRVVFDNLVSDIETLMANFDKDLQEIYRKNGLVKVADR